MCEFLRGGDAAECHIGTIVVVCPEPLGRRILRVGDGRKEVLRSPVVAHRAIEAFNVGILLWLPWLNELEANAARCRPRLHRVTDVLRVVVHTDVCSSAPYGWVWWHVRHSGSILDGIPTTRRPYEHTPPDTREQIGRAHV